MPSIDLAHFTPWSALAGGLLIGLSAGVLMLWNGRIAGISGILAGALPGMSQAGRERHWRLAFLAGLLLAGWLLPHWLASQLPALPTLPATLSAAEATGSSPARLVLAGLLVGLGTRVGSGCTSGHGVCGLSRGSLRSLVAVLVFMGTGAVAVALVRHVLP